MSINVFWVWNWGWKKPKCIFDCTHCGVLHYSKHKSKLKGQFCTPVSRALQYAIYACGIFEREVYLAFSSSNLKSDLPWACQLDTKPNWNLDFKKPFPPPCPWPVLSNQIQFPMQLLIRKKAKSCRCLDLNTRIRNARSRCKRGRR